MLSTFSTDDRLVAFSYTGQGTEWPLSLGALAAHACFVADRDLAPRGVARVPPGQNPEARVRQAGTNLTPCKTDAANVGLIRRVLQPPPSHATQVTKLARHLTEEPLGSRVGLPRGTPRHPRSLGRRARRSGQPTAPHELTTTPGIRHEHVGHLGRLSRAIPSIGMVRSYGSVTSVAISLDPWEDIRWHHRLDGSIHPSEE